MSNRPRRLLLYVPVALAAVLALGAWALWPRTAITRENAAKIHVGMTRVEVETILGGPPRDETTGPFELDLVEPARWQEGSLETRWIDFMILEPPARRVMWHSDQVVIWVQWNEGCVHAFDCFPLRRTSENPIDLFRRWLRL